MTVSADVVRSSRKAGSLPGGASRVAQLSRVAWFAVLSVAASAVAYVASVPPALMPFVLVAVPTLLAVGMAWHEGHGAVRRMFHAITLRPGRRRWYLVLLVPLAWAGATVAVAVALGEPAAGLFDNVFPAILIVPLVVLLPAFIEELAWRGFALPRLLSVMSPLAGALVLAIPWTLVHVVLFLPGQQYDILAMWAMVLSIFAYSIVLTWVFIGTGGSVLITALLHAGLNGVAPLMAGVDADASWAIRNVLAAALAVGVIAAGGFTRGAAPTPPAGPPA